ncbi:GLPGLI family protein [Macellibacteroides fermentans]|uniref:GLPGLI family protein n=1 Tax=Macellibacteroides fermentans TaxID=879969 RepID=UPI00406CCB0D
MRCIILFSYCLLIVNGICAQSPQDAGIYPPDMDKYTVLDSANYKFIYEFTYLPDTLKLNSPMKNQLILELGNKISRFYSADYFIKRVVSGKVMNADSGVRLSPGHGLNGTEIYKNYKEKKETITTRVSGTAEIFTYEEDIPLLKWQITRETATILSYSCTKAITTFRGRTFEAWFTMEIPISNGPWKLGGLPGLILKTSDRDGFFKFTCIGIEALKIKEPIVKYEGKYVATSRKNINRLVRNLHENSIQTYEGMGLIYIGDKSKPKMPKPYNPIERE